MESSYRVRADELDSGFLESLRHLFGNRMIEIKVAAVDETEYLLANEANKERLLSAIENIESRDNLVSADLDIYA